MEGAAQMGFRLKTRMYVCGVGRTRVCVFVSVCVSACLFLSLREIYARQPQSSYCELATPNYMQFLDVFPSAMRPVCLWS